MDDYYLVQKHVKGDEHIVYQMAFDGKDFFINLKVNNDGFIGPIRMGYGVKETKRGWSYTTKSISGNVLKVFLPRENFNKKGEIPW